MNEVPKTKKEIDGWTFWAGGECPLPPDTMVDYKMRVGPQYNFPRRAGELRWSHIGYEGDIVAYCLYEPKPAIICPTDEDCWTGLQKEMVNHPDHYGGGDNPYEAIKVIEAWSLNFSLGSAVKYISRWNKKGAGIEDLKKARRYLDFEIARLEREEVKYLAGEIGNHYKKGE
jgi:hypothetical protein